MTEPARPPGSTRPVLVAILGAVLLGAASVAVQIGAGVPGILIGIVLLVAGVVLLVRAARALARSRDPRG